jgi:hypothetical protein
MSAAAPQGVGQGVGAPVGRRSAFDKAHSFLRTIVGLGVIALLGWWTVFFRGLIHENERQLAERDERIVALGVEIEQKEARIRELEAALALLKVDHRVARIEVLEQGGEPPTTRLRFTELEPDGAPLGPAREATIDGNVVYVDALVLKFEDDYVERGDALRGTSLCLFRRLFGERQKPEDGVALDSPGQLPAAYSPGDAPGEAGAYYADLWARFWDYANDPKLAREQGVRAAHGEAPFIELRPGKTYRLELRASGGLTIAAE